MSETLRGFRISNGDSPARVVTPAHMSLNAGEELLAELRERAVTERANCLNRWDEFSGDAPVTNERAEELCTGCNIRALCGEYAKVSKPAWGVHDGKWYGEE